MISKFIKLLPFLPIILLFSISACAEEYIFTTRCDFPMVCDSSLEVVNADHNVYVADDFDSLRPLIDCGIVDYYEPMSYSYLFDYSTDDAYYSEQSNLSVISALFAWNKNVFGDSVKIAVIDSGFYQSAADFNRSNIHLVRDYTHDNSGTTLCNDTIGHGTMVSGIIAASHNKLGIAGIAPNVEIYVFKCFYLDSNGYQNAKNSDILSAIYEAVDTYNVDIINLSFGTTNSTVFKSAIDYAYNSGALIVAAAGNDGAQSGSRLYYPASYDNVISVGSIDSSGHRATHSQRNDLVNIMAPGENIISTYISPSYYQGTGTSYATPQVTAAAALAKSLNPSLDSRALMQALYFSATEMPDRYSGHGALNIQSLLAYVTATLNPGNIVTSSNNTRSFAYCIPTDGYTAYFALYDDDTLTDIKKHGVNVLSDDFRRYIYYVWKNGTLEPYNKNLIIIDY